MRALSLNLIKGLIDEIEHKIYISWVQPRVLDITQVTKHTQYPSFSLILVIISFFLR